MLPDDSPLEGTDARTSARVDARGTSPGLAPTLTEPPRGTVLDRLARWFEGGGRGEPVTEVVDLASLLSAGDLARLSREIVSFYRSPMLFEIEVGLDAARFSRVLLAIGAAVTRQTDLPDAVDGFEGAPLGQLVYRDRRGRVHWDRYAFAGGRWRRLFLARMSSDAGFFVETFCVYGLPIALPFRVTVEGESLVLTLTRRWSAPFSWLGRVEYRADAEGSDRVRTRGTFAIPLLGFRVTTDFRAVRGRH